MDHNQAIASIASAAIAQIRQVAIEAIQATSYSDGNQTETASFGSDESLAKLAQHVKVNPPSDVQDRPRRGRPRLGPTQPAAPEVTTAVTLTPASTQTDEVEIEIEAVADEDSIVLEETKVESTAEIEASPDDFDPVAGNYPALSDKWFTDNIDDARTLCRQIASLRLKALGPVDAKKEIMEITKRSRVTDFTVDDCATYYRATTALMAVE